MTVKGNVNKPKMFAARISAANIEKARMLSRVKGVPMADVFDLMASAYEPTVAESDAIRALMNVDCGSESQIAPSQSSAKRRKGAGK